MPSSPISRLISDRLRQSIKKLDSAFADAVIKDGVPFNTCQSINWKPFWDLVFGSAYRIPHRLKISDTFLSISYDNVLEKCIEKFNNAKAFCLSLDGFSDKHSKSVFHALVCSPIPIHIQSFRLGGERESSLNLNKQIKNVLGEFCKVYKQDVPYVYGLVTDSPNVMKKTRKLCTGQQEGGELVSVFAYGCACHALSLIIKDILKIDSIKQVFDNVLLMASFFRNTHLANHLLEVERKNLNPTPKSIKTFSPTRWNGCSVMFRSVLDCRQAITHVFTNEMTKPTNDGQLLDISDRKSKAYSALQLSLNREFWTQLEKITPILELFSAVLTYLESDLCPLSMVPLVFATLYKFSSECFNETDAQSIKDSLVARYNTICSDVHILSFVLDPVTLKDRYSDLIPFLGNRVVLSVAQAAMERDLKSVGATEEEIEVCTRHLATYISETNCCTALSKSFHPLLWWTSIGSERCKVLAPIAYRVFSLSSSSAGVERSFKIRSRLHGKSRCQLTDSKADKQSSIIFNSSQLGRIDDSVLATKRGGKVFEFIVLGHEEFTQTNGSALAELVSSVCDNGGQALDAHESVEVDIDLDDDSLFGDVSAFVGNIDELLCVT